MLKLAEHYALEANTATLAMGELSERGHKGVIAIAQTILQDESVDQYLIASALADLAEMSMPEAMPYIERYGVGDNSYLVKEVVEVLVYCDDSVIDDRLLTAAQNIQRAITHSASIYDTDAEFMMYVYQPFMDRFFAGVS